MKTVIIPENIKLPQVSPDSPELNYGFMTLMAEMCYSSPQALEDANLDLLVSVSNKFKSTKIGDAVALTDEEHEFVKTSVRESLNRMIQSGKIHPLWSASLTSLYHPIAKANGTSDVKKGKK